MRHTLSVTNTLLCSEIGILWLMRWHWYRTKYEHCSTGIVGHGHGVGHGYRHEHCRTLQVLQHWLLWPASNFFALEWAPAASWIFSPPRFVCQPRFHCLVIIIVMMMRIKTRMSLKTRMNDLPLVVLQLICFLMRLPLREERLRENEALDGPATCKRQSCEADEKGYS